MSAERISVTLPPDLAAGAADSMSAFVADAVRSRLRRDRDLAALARVLGGAPPREVIDAVRRDLGLPPEPTP